MTPPICPRCDTISTKARHGAWVCSPCGLFVGDTPPEPEVKLDSQARYYLADIIDPKDNR